MQFFSIDATKERRCGPRLGRLVNHGNTETERNCKMKVVDGYGNRPWLCLFATKRIQFGDQILYDYGIRVPSLQIIDDL